MINGKKLHIDRGIDNKRQRNRLYIDRGIDNR